MSSSTCGDADGRDSTSGLRSLLRPTVALPLVFLALFQLWGVLRTVPFLGIYGLDALRDGVVWGYAFFAWSTLVILAVEPGRFRELAERYKVFLVVFLCLIPLVTLLSWAFYDRLPTIGVTDRFLFELRSGEVLTHLAGITAYLALMAPGFPASAMGLVFLSAALALFYGSSEPGQLARFWPRLGDNPAASSRSPQAGVGWSRHDGRLRPVMVVRHMVQCALPSA